MGWANGSKQNRGIPKKQSTLKKGEFVIVKVNDCTSATLIGQVVD